MGRKVKRMYKAKLLPLFFTEANDREKKELEDQLQNLEEIYGAEAELLPAQPVGSKIPDDVQAVLFPQLIGAIFSHQKDLNQITKPIVVLTSKFGTVEMWDWEIVAYLRNELKLNVFTPYNIELAKVILRAIAMKQEMTTGIKFLMFQDSPGEGMQANIFKRFYWWESECIHRIEETFGIQLVYKSWKQVNVDAHRISDAEALELLKDRPIPVEGLSEENILKPVKLYLALKKVIDETGDVRGVGSNCLNESFNSETTPCLAWCWLFDYDHLIWACEGDIVTLISKYIFHSALKSPMMMTNIYPFLVGMAALKHEKIDHFPDIEDPDNHALGVHCGYFGLAPRSFCSTWTMRPKVLGIVNENAIVIDCRFAKGLITMAKLSSDMKTLTVIEAEIVDYVQYPGSDCRNGALIRYRNKSGHRVMENLSSHHAIIIQGDVTYKLNQLAKVFQFEIEIM